MMKSVTVLDGNVNFRNPGGVRTIFVFRDLPVHYELQAGYLPLLKEVNFMDFDLEVNLSDPSRKNAKRPVLKTYSVKGQYQLVRVKLKYASEGKPSLTQYVECEPFKVG